MWTSALERLDASGLRRTLRGGGAGTEIERDGRWLINMASNDYLGLSRDPRLAEAARKEAERSGVGATASRLITGSHPVHEALEQDLATSRGTEAALVFSSGYAANVGSLSALAKRGDLVLADALSHASLLDGVKLSGAQLTRFRHQNLEQLDDLLRAARKKERARHLFIVTEGVFSMDGDVSDIAVLVKLAKRHDATLIVDDAHGGGVLGPQGRGTIAAFELAHRVPVQVGTLSKALGTQGGYVAGSRAMIDVLVNRARSFVFSTGLSPMVAGAARAAVEIARTEDWRRETLLAHGAALREAARVAGMEVLGDERAPMVLLVVGGAAEAVRMSAALEAEGVLAPAIRPPTVPEEAARLRLAPMATHTEKQITAVAEALTRVAR